MSETLDDELACTIVFLEKRVQGEEQFLGTMFLLDNFNLFGCLRRIVCDY